MRASMIRHTSRRLTVRPASSPRTATLIASSSSMEPRCAVPWRILSSSATWSEVLIPIAMSLAGADVGPGDAQLLLGLGQHRFRGREGARDQLVDLHARREHAFGQVLDGGRGRRDDVRLDLEPDRAHPERVLHALLAVDDEPARQDVEHLAVARDRHGARDLGGAIDVLAGDLAVVAADGDRAARVLGLDVLAADADERPVDLPAAEALGVLHRRRDGVHGLIDIDDDALLQPGGRHGTLADDRDAAIAADLADQRDDLRRPDVDPDQDRLSFHALVVPRCALLEEMAPDEGHVLEDPGPERDQCHEVQVQPEPVTDEGEQDRDAGIGDEAADEDPVVVDAVELRPDRPEDRIEGCDDGHGRVSGELEADVDVEDEPGKDAQDEPCQGKKHAAPPSTSVRFGKGATNG
jgi:hypothetical protein